MRLVLLLSWAVLTVAGAAFVAVLGSNCPNSDEWGFVPALTGHEPLGPWLWAQHNEHRLPLPRLIYYGLFQETYDFRAGSFLQVGLLSATSLWLMRVAARLRGRPYWTDLFFPVSLLHVGHWENLLIGYNLCFALFLVLETALGAIALTAKRETLFRSGLLAGMLMVLLCLCGGGGLIAALPVAMWLVYLALLETRQAKGVPHTSPLRGEFEIVNPIDRAATPEEKVHLQKLAAANQPFDATAITSPSSAIIAKDSAGARRVLQLMFAAFPFIYLAIYLQEYHRPGHHPQLGDGGFDVVRVFAQVLTMAFGHGLSRQWVAGFTLIAALGAITLFRLGRRLRSPEQRPAAIGVLAVTGGIVGVALIIGLGRAGLDGRSGLASRYAYLTWPLLGTAFLYWTKEGGRLGKWIPAALCLIAAIAYPMNMGRGLQSGLAVHATLQSVEVDARTGAPAETIVQRFANTFQAHQEERAIRAMPLLREAGVGAFAEGGR